MCNVHKYLFELIYMYRRVLVPSLVNWNLGHNSIFRQGCILYLSSCSYLKCHSALCNFKVSCAQIAHTDTTSCIHFHYLKTFFLLGLMRYYSFLDYTRRLYYKARWCQDETDCSSRLPYNNISCKLKHCILA